MITGWTEYALALLVFMASHFMPRLWGVRERLIGAVGRPIYFSLYGFLSLALLVWVITAAGRAPHVEVWSQVPWTRWVPNLAMPFATILVLCGFRVSYPFTLGGRRKAVFDPENPGFAAISRHPLFVALAIWAGSHLLPNGDLAHVILFGCFFVMPLAAIPAFDAKARRDLAPDTSQTLFATTSVLSFAPLMDRRWIGLSGRPMAIRCVIALALWLALLHSHTAVIGASPFPF